MISDLSLRSLIHFELIFVFGVRKCLNFFLLHVALQFPQQHLLEKLFLLHCVSLPFCCRSTARIHVGSSLSTLFCSMCLFSCQHHAILIPVAL